MRIIYANNLNTKHLTVISMLLLCRIYNVYEQRSSTYILRPARIVHIALLVCCVYPVKTLNPILL